jgi:hypothetical protein
MAAMVVDRRPSVEGRAAAFVACSLVDLESIARGE